MFKSPSFTKQTTNAKDLPNYDPGLKQLDIFKCPKQCLKVPRTTLSTHLGMSAAIDLRSTLHKNVVFRNMDIDILVNYDRLITPALSKLFKRGAQILKVFPCDKSCCHKDYFAYNSYDEQHLSHILDNPHQRMCLPCFLDSFIICSVILRSSANSGLARRILNRMHSRLQFFLSLIDGEFTLHQNTDEKIEEYADAFCLDPAYIDESGLTVNELRRILDMFIKSYNSVEVKQYLNGIFKISKKALREHCDRLRQICLTRYSEQKQNLISDNFARALKTFECYNETKSLMMYERLFGKPSVGKQRHYDLDFDCEYEDEFGFDINHNLAIPQLMGGGESLKKMISKLPGVSGVNQVLINLLWFIYDVLRGERFIVAAARFLTTGSASCTWLLERGKTLYTALLGCINMFKDTKCSEGQLIDLTEMAEEDENLIQFEDESGPEHAESFVKAFAGLAMGLLNAKTEDKVALEKMRLTRLTNVSKFLTSSKNIYEFAIRGAFKSYEFLSAHLKSEEDAIEEMRVNFPDILEWIETFDKMDSNRTDPLILSVQRDSAVARKVLDLKLSADKWIIKYGSKYVGHTFWSVFLAKYRRLMSYHDKAAAFVCNYKSRAAPFVLLLQGDPGIGKTHMIRHIASVLYRARGKQFDIDREVYMRPGVSEYWDGYTNQRMVYYNDLLQSTSDDARKSVAMEFISMAQTAPMPLNCADVELKGRKFFDSELVMADCNVMPSEATLRMLVTSPEAFLRRFPFVIKPELRPEWIANGRFDISKATQAFHPEAYLFRINDEQETCNFEQLIVRLHSSWISHRQVQARNLEASNCGLSDEWLAKLPKWEPEVAGEFDLDDDVPLLGFEDESGIEITLEPPSTADFLSCVKPKERKVFDLNTETCTDDFGESLIDTTPKFVKYSLMPLKLILNEEKYLKIEDVFSDKYNLIKDTAENQTSKLSTKTLELKKQWTEYVRSMGTFKRRFMMFAGVAVLIVPIAYALFSSMGKDKEEKEFSEEKFERTQRQRKRLQYKREMDMQNDEFAKDGSSPTLAANRRRFKRRNNDEFAKDGSTPTMTGQRRRFRRNVDEFGEEPIDESSKFEACEPQIRKASKSLCKIRNSDGVRVCGWFYTDSVVVFPNHFFIGYEPNGEMVYEISTAVGQWTLNASELKDFVIDPDRDIRMINLGVRHIPAQVGLKKYLASKDFECSSEATLLSARDLCGEGRDYTRYSIDDLNVNSDIKYGPRASDVVRNVHKAYRYKADSGPGDCGSVLFAMTKTQNAVVIGHHMAGSRGYGLSTMITSENCLRLYNELKQGSEVFEQQSVELNDTLERLGKSVPLTEQDNLNIIGSLPTQEMPILASKTTVEPSLLHGIYEPITKPAMLKPTGKIDPLRLGSVKMARKNVDVDLELLDYCRKSVQSKLLALSSTYKNNPRVLTNDEAINGVDGDSLIKSINVKTSCGWPFKLWSSAPGKKGYLVQDETTEKWSMTDEFQHYFDETEDSLKNNNSTPMLFFDCLKDERRPIPKAECGNTRVFSVGPLDFTLLMKKYTATFQAHCMANATRCGSAVGINPHSPEWGELMTRLLTGGSNFIAGDYGKWDKWIAYPILMAVNDIMTAFYKDQGTEQCRVRTQLCRTAFSAKRICGRVVYQTTGGMPSGTPGTSIFNSLANEILFRYVFELIRMDNNSPCESHVYDRCTQFTAYGDDHVVAVSDMLPWFNMLTVSNKFKEMGIEYTDAAKTTTEFTDAYVPPEELVYLKRKFVRFSAVHFLAPLEKTVIQESLNWSHGESCEATMRSTINSAMLEMVHHGKDQFERFCDYVAEQCAQIGIASPTVHYQSVLRRILEGTIVLDNVSPLCDLAVLLE